METKTQVVLLSFADGSLGVMRFVTFDGRAGWTREANAENINAEISRSLFPPEKGAVLSWRLGSEEDIPTDRTYRNAWVDNGGKIEHHMERARDLHRDILRRARRSLLEELDVQYTRADEQGDTAAKADVVKRKQALRDITKDPRIAAAATPEELKTIVIGATA